MLSVESCYEVGDMIRWISWSDRIQVQVSFVDPRKDVIHFKEVSPQEAQAIS